MFRRAVFPVFFAVLVLLPLSGRPAAAVEPPSAWDLAYAEAVNAFAADIYARVRSGGTGGTESNLAFSPLSLHAAMLIVEAGSNGRTSDELRAALRLDDLPRGDAGDVACFRHGLVSGTGGGNAVVELRNGAWVDRRRELRPGYVRFLEEAYGVAPRTVDFVGDPRAACRAISEELLAGFAPDAPDLVPPAAAADDSCIVLGDCLIYSGAWERPFPAAGTADRTFRLPDGREIDAPTMHYPPELAAGWDMGNFRHAGCDWGQALEMPCQGGKSLLVLLPREPGGLPVVEGLLEPEWLADVCAGLERARVEVFLPRFGVERRWEAAAALRDMGVRDCFSLRADLSEMVAANDMYVRLVPQHCRFRVDEQRIDAGAATAVLIRTKGGEPAPEGDTVVFRADHPFLYLLRDVRTGAIMFMGRVVDPRV